ncbi:MAG: hypothetical protein EHM20_00090 [Alphaproteobacteria bacterium]|nr:MAG: hypothetical protein EHM20_00090 [Alphaproteobacteria bacterium]
MQANIINYYKKITDLAIKNIAQEKQFRFRSKLNSSVLILQSEDFLIKQFKKASGGGPLSDEAKKLIADYKTSIKRINILASKSYDSTLAKLKKAKTDDEKLKILHNLAGKGFAGFKTKDGKIWNIETYTNMLFTYMSNEMVRQGVMSLINNDKYKISDGHTICDICKLYEGKTLTREELERAKSNGLFHPNCVHFIIEVKDE